MFAVGGTSVGWWVVGLAVSAFYTVSQLLVVLGKHEMNWPLWKASTQGGQVGLLVLGCAFVIFCLIGLATSA